MDETTADGRRDVPDAQGTGDKGKERSLLSCGYETGSDDGAANDADATNDTSDWPGASKQGSNPLQPGLYVVATPIGNLGDISQRALDTLAAADVVACEDTRVTAKLLGRFGIKATLLAYHDHNADRMRPQLLERLDAGERIALVSDAGTPLVSDPGFKLVRDAVAAGHAARTVPGPSAVTAALSIAGLATNAFYFGGFLPTKTQQRRRALQRLAALDATLVFFESGKRLADTLAVLADTLGPRPAAVARELTKIYEEVRRDPLDRLAAYYREQGPPRGEIVILIGPPEATADAEEAGADALVGSRVDEQAVDALLRTLSAQIGVKRAAAMVAAALGLAKRPVYQRALALKPEKDD